jgi:hypothetical protein
MNSSARGPGGGPAARRRPGVWRQRERSQQLPRAQAPGSRPHGLLSPPCLPQNELQTTTGYRINVVTVRKLEFETDAYAFADKVRAAQPSLRPRPSLRAVWGGRRRRQRRRRV